MSGLKEKIVELVCNILFFYDQFRSWWSSSAIRLVLRHFLHHATQRNPKQQALLKNKVKPVRPLCFLFLSHCFPLAFTLPQIDLRLSPRGLCSGRYWGLLLVCTADNMDEWSQTDNLPTDIDLTHITAAHNRHGIASPADKHLLKLDKLGCQEVDQSSHFVTS